ncbi:GDP-D-glucose phosphorylase 1 [Brienomyrus brachyistius]|uniref:GDP-D-glucose phosphorylase 1 n=1 Tax=Brienomyrus brachyistius TaxID=42636 RepID=UPI0020B3C827|nr:GDP-D-glucose phosphorylase 1 [Brienomyrus brachyistius]
MATCVTQHFVYSDQDFVRHVCWSERCGRCSKLSKFDNMLRSGWAAKMSQGMFRYHLGDLQTRILPGGSQFVIQLNIKRGQERRKPQEILSIRQSFDPNQFNFNKISANEIIFEMSKENTIEPHSGPHLKDGRGHSCHDSSKSGLVRMLVVINVSPLEFGHCLFIPNPTQCLPQILNATTIRTGIESVLLSCVPGFRVGFNSLGGFASVNHLHLHGYYLDYELRIESAPSESLIPGKGFYRLTEFPFGFLFYTEGLDLSAVSGDICQLTDYLVRKNIAHNLFFTRGCSPRIGFQPDSDRSGVRVVVWPRTAVFGAKEESAFNVALCELAGHLPFKSQEEFDTATENNVKHIIQKYLLPEEDFFQLQLELIELFTQSLI